MLRRIVPITLAVAVLAAPALAQDAGVAGRPALATDSLDKLIKQREQWGTAPAKPAAAAKPAEKSAPKTAAPAAGAKQPVAKKPVVKKAAAKKKPAPKKVYRAKPKKKAN